MLIINSSTRENSSNAICNTCDKEVMLVLHHDFLEANCSCGEQYSIKVNDGVWNCCSDPENK